MNGDINKCDILICLKKHVSIWKNHTTQWTNISQTTSAPCWEGLSSVDPSQSSSICCVQRRQALTLCYQLDMDSVCPQQSKYWKLLPSVSMLRSEGPLRGGAYWDVFTSWKHCPGKGLRKFLWDVDLVHKSVVIRRASLASCHSRRSLPLAVLPPLWCDREVFRRAIIMVPHPQTSRTVSQVSLFSL
jgi:hypothetical protein